MNWNDLIRTLLGVTAVTYVKLLKFCTVTCTGVYHEYLFS